MRSLKKTYKQWLDAKRSDKTYGPHSMEDYKIMWDVDKLKNAKIIKD